MRFLLADTFTASLAKLTNAEQKAAKLTAFDLQTNPESPGLRWHKLPGMKDDRFSSVSASMDLRLIVHRSQEGGSLLLCYVDHHDAAYRWAGRRRLETHPKTGAAQLVEVVEKAVEEAATPPPADRGPAGPDAEAVRGAEPEAEPTYGGPALGGVDAERLLGFGVPEAWVDAVRAATEAELLELAEKLPGEAQEAILRLLVGEEPEPAAVVPGPEGGAPADPFTHPDAERRFRVVARSEDLQRALDAPWEAWAVFLHPSQRVLVGKRFNGPARVAGSAGTGKTVVALHRAVALARRGGDAPVLLTTFSRPLARLLRARLRRLTGDDEELAARIEVATLDDAALGLHEAQAGSPRLATPPMQRKLVAQAVAAEPEHPFSADYANEEWRSVVDAWQLSSWEGYRDVARLGRRTRLGEKQRRALWSVFERVRAELEAAGLVTPAGVYAAAAAHPGTPGRWSAVVVDEAQDLSVPQLRLLAAVAQESGSGGGGGDALFFAGDLGQRIFEAPFSWKSLGVDVRGRSTTLKVNYRTSHPIRRLADRLLDPKVADVDGVVEERRGTVSAFTGPEPEVALFEDEAAEAAAAGAWLAERVEDGVAPHEIGVFVRSDAQLPRARAAVAAAGLEAAELDGGEPARGHVVVAVMHAAKGLEFRSVAVLACDEGVLPLEERIAALTDPAELGVAYATERHLFYVACTRARDRLLVAGVQPGSEYLEDLRV